MNKKIKKHVIFRKMNLVQRLKFIYKERGGLCGLYRGIAPGTARSFVANGVAMVVMTHAWHMTITKLFSSVSSLLNC